MTGRHVISGHRAGPEEPGRRPNLLLFMPETVRADTVFGDPAGRARTPNIDQLAREGVAFTSCFAQMSYCSPSRVGMFTGLYPHTNGHRSLMHLLRRDEHQFFRDLMQAGYTNVVYGKNDLLAQDAIPLSFAEADLRIAPEKPTFMTNPWPQGHRFRHSFYRGQREGRDTHDMDWACIESALQFLDEPHDRPFCLFLPLIFAHPPYEVEEPFFSMHPRDRVPAPVAADLAGKRTYMQVLHRVQCGELTEEDYREIRATYFGMVSRVDHQLGLLIERLKERGLYDDTIVVVFSDHGDYAGDFGMVEKYLAGFEDCLLHVPLIIRVPGGTSSGERGALCEMTDLYPTLMDLVGLEPAHYHFGRSLVPLLRGEVETHRDAVFAEGGFHTDENEFLPTVPKGSDYDEMLKVVQENPRMARRAAMVRTDQYKYVYCPEDRDELYDLSVDPAELHNLAEVRSWSGVREAMRERLMRWMLDTGDALPPETDPRGWR